MIATYHNHSTWSDGIAPIEGVVRRARELGVEELGISDHFVLHPSGVAPVWSMPPRRLGEYVGELRSWTGGAGEAGPRVRVGLEVDWFPGRGEEIRAALEPFEFDYLIGSVHEVDGFRIDSTPDEWDRLTVEEQDEKHRLYWRAKRSLAESGLFDIVAHLDLSKKFGHRPTVDLSDEIGAALDAIAGADIVVELNTAGWHKPCRDGYPSLDILRECRRRKIRVTLSADAHDPDHLLRDFDRGAQRLRDAGFDRVARFTGRAVTMEAI